jgi:YbgC/YbaW family acyl-CoA thioester hydrolase
MFQHPFTVRLSQTDAGGVVYFAEYFNIAHQCYEAFLDTIWPVGQGIEQGILMPIVHAEADYRAPLRVSQQGCVEMSAPEVRRSSYTLAYRIQGDAADPAVSVRTAHAVVGLDWKPRRIPGPLAAALKTLAPPI